jgi:streptogramin lyase
MKNLSLTARNLEAKPGVFAWAPALLSAALVTVLNLGFLPPASAAITVVSYWHMGESDPGVGDGIAATSTVDFVGLHILNFKGPAFYSSDVAIPALAHVGSSRSVSFGSGAFASNSIVSTATDNFGIEAWVKPAAVIAGQVIAYNGATDTSGWGLIVSGSNYLALFGGNDVWGVGTATPNVWTHVALVRDGGVATIYTNGVAAGTSLSAPNVPVGNFAIAAPPQSPTSQFLTGLADEVRVFTFVPGQFSTNDLLVNKSPFRLGTTSLLQGPAAGTNGVTLAVNPETLAWTAAANASWLHLSAANQSGTGSTNIVFTFDVNAGAARTGTLTIAGQTVTVSQAGAIYVAAAPVLITTGLSNPTGVAIDNSGNVYIADNGHLAIKKWTATNNTVSTLISMPAPSQNPWGVAVDGAGIVYFGLEHYGTVYQWTPATSNLTAIMNQPPSSAFGVAVDDAGNVYVADGQSSIREWKASDGSVTSVGTGLTTPYGIAVDAAGNVYFTDGNNSALRKWSVASNTVSTLVSSGLNNPRGVAVDQAGNVYIAGYSDQAVEEWSVALGSLKKLVSSGLLFPAGVAVDRAGNVYIADSSHGAVKELPHAFVDAAVKTESASAGTDALGSVLPATANMNAPFAPTSDQSWLTIGAINNGVVSFSFTANTGATRTAHITLFGVSITVNQAGAVTSPLLTGAKILSGGAIQFSFTNNPAGSFTVVSTTNVSLPLSQWTVAGVPTVIAPGVFQFTSGLATNGPRRFYSVRSP